MLLLHASERFRTFPFQFLRSSRFRRSKELRQSSKPFPRTMVLNSVPALKHGLQRSIPNASLFLSGPSAFHPKCFPILITAFSVPSQMLPYSYHGLQRSIPNASLFLSRPMPGQPCGKEPPFGWLHLQLKNLGSPIRFLLDGFTACGQSILPQKREGRDADNLNRSSCIK
ncbi:hypothetical protein CEXT_341731 [Caerostris extrusa]|uniref:Uncharacterized protein n=1 Tax=Caerostris extrusa TaxID=172846 RepID=A0AAV4QUV7_CAEEX|nr:hypothetical protein CEXT_341731 [Caerostris extrusa]